MKIGERRRNTATKKKVKSVRARGIAWKHLETSSTSGCSVVSFCFRWIKTSRRNHAPRMLNSDWSNEDLKGIA